MLGRRTGGGCEVLNKALEQRYTRSNMVGPVLILLPSIRIRYAQQTRMESGKDVRYVGIDDCPSGNIGKSDGQAGAQGHSLRKLEGRHQTYGKILRLTASFYNAN